MHGATQPASIPEIAGTDGQNSGSTETGTQNDTDATLSAKRLQALLGALAGGPSTQGASGQFGIGSTGRLALKSEFPRPMAVGAGSRLKFPIENALLIAEGEPDSTEKQSAQDVQNGYDVSKTLFACGVILRSSTDERSRFATESEQNRNQNICGKNSKTTIPENIRNIKEYMCRKYSLAIAAATLRESQ